MPAQLLTAERLRELMHYDPETGVFTRIAHANTYRGNTQLGVIKNRPGVDGYVSIRVEGTKYRANRLAWLYMASAWPKHQIDHRNGTRCDDRWANLREVTNTVNCQNQRRAKANSSTGLLGVRRNRANFQAAIYVNKVCKYLGTFSTPEAAHEAYLAAKRILHQGNTL